MTKALSLLFVALSCGLTFGQEKAAKMAHANVPYGPHEANVLDIWIAEGKGPRPLHVYIHGGGWIGGDIM